MKSPQMRIPRTPPAIHEITTQYFNSSDHTRWTCTCGATNRWEGNDGSAEAEGEAHIERHERDAQKAHTRRTEEMIHRAAPGLLN